MKVFISWSGERSREVAVKLNRWIERNIQLAETWISTDDIGAGDIWFQQIKLRLDETSVGIICLTKENVNNPWILFEAGALAKGTKENKVCTFLIDLKAGELKPPLSQFNATWLEHGSFRKLVKTISDGLDRPLSESVIDDVMGSAWANLNAEIDEIVSRTKSGPTPLKMGPDEMLSEVLRLVTQSTHTLARQQNDILELSARIEHVARIASPELRLSDYFGLAENKENERVQKKPSAREIALQAARDARNHRLHEPSPFADDESKSL